MDSRNCGYCEFCAIGNYKSCVENRETSPTLEMLSEMAYLLNLVPRGDIVPVQILEVLQKQFMAVMTVALPHPNVAPGDGPCKLCNGRGFYGTPGARCEWCKGTGRGLAAPEEVTKEDLVKAIELCHRDIFSQCCSNPVKNAWGQNVDMTSFNEMYLLAITARKELK